VKPHKVHYYMERRDPEFARKMAEVLCVHREVKILKEIAAQVSARISFGFSFSFVSPPLFRLLK